MTTNPDQTSQPLRDYWRILLRGRWLIITAFLVIVASTALFSWLADPVYEAPAKLLVERRKLPGAGDLMDLVLNPLTSGTRNELENRIEVLLSRPVLEEARKKLLANQEFIAIRRWLAEREGLLSTVAKAVGLNRNSNNNKEALITVEDLKKRISARPMRNTDIIEVKAQGNTPREAQLIADTVIQAYMEQEAKHTKRTLSSVKDFLNEQLQLTQARLEGVEEQAVAFQKKSGLELGPEGAVKNLIELNKLLIKGKIELEDKQDALEAVQKLLEGVREELLDKQATSEELEALLLELRNKVTSIRKIQLEIAELEEKRAKALKEDDHIKAQALQNEILQKKQEIEQQGAQQFKVLNLLPKYEELIRRELQLAIEIEALKNRIKAVQETIDREAKKLIESGLELLRLQRGLEVDKKIYILLREQYEKARIAEAGEPGTVRLVHAAEEPTSPIRPKKALNLILAALVGLTLGTGLAFMKEYLDNTYKSPQEVEKDLNVVGLGSLYFMKHEPAAEPSEELKRALLTCFDAKSAAFTAYSGLQTNLSFVALEKPLKSLLITSSVPGEGKTTSVINLGMALSYVGKKVLLIEGDLRRPTFAKIFDLKSEKGFTDLILGQVSPEEAICWAYRKLDGEALGQYLVDLKKLSHRDFEKAKRLYHRKAAGDRAAASEQAQKRPMEKILVEEKLIEEKALQEALAQWRGKLERLYVLPAGQLPPNPTAILGSERAHKVLEELNEKFDMLLIDSPPVTAVPDAAVLSRQADGVLLIIEAEETDREVVKEAVEQLRKAEAHLVGIALNKVKPSSAYGYYGKYHRYSYYGYYGEARKS